MIIVVLRAMLNSCPTRLVEVAYLVQIPVPFLHRHPNPIPLHRCPRNGLGIHWSTALRATLEISAIILNSYDHTCRNGIWRNVPIASVSYHSHGWITVAHIIIRNNVLIRPVSIKSGWEAATKLTE